MFEIIHHFMTNYDKFITFFFTDVFLLLLNMAPNFSKILNMTLSLKDYPISSLFSVLTNQIRGVAYQSLPFAHTTEI